MSIALRARQPPSKPHHGQFIYLFSNLKTHQVIYSLEKEIHTERQERQLLKQLPFYGKKTVPTKLRKDLWKPYATVTLSRPEHGLSIYKLLKEYRMVRDHAWTFAPTEADKAKAVAQEKAIQDAKDMLFDPNPQDPYQGLAKLETRFSDNVLSHYTFFPSKKERAKLLMDQRATSVADLAAIISRTLRGPASGITYKERNAKKQRQKLWAKVEGLASTPEAEIQKLVDEKEELIRSAAVTTYTQQGQAEKSKIKRRKKRIDEITTHLNRLRKAREAVAFATGSEDILEAQRAKWSKTLKYIVQMQNPSRPVMSNYDRTAADARREAEAHARPSNWPASRKYDADPTSDTLPAPKMLTRRDKIALQHAEPEVDARFEKGVAEDGVLIQWANLPDAQFAGQWHEAVVHEAMEDKYVKKVAKAFGAERGLFVDEVAVETSNPLPPPSALPVEEQKEVGGIARDEKEEKAGFFGAINPMRLFRKGGDARP